jgi:RNA polymerase-binding transcription factor DksA
MPGRSAGSPVESGAHTAQRSAHGRIEEDEFRHQGLGEEGPCQVDRSEEVGSDEGVREGTGQEGRGEEGPCHQGCGEEGPCEPEGSAAKKAPAKKAPAKKAPAKKAPTTKAAPKNAPARTASDETTVTKPTAATKKTPAAPAARKPRQPGVTSLTPSLLSNATFERVEIPAPRGRTKDGIAYTKDFDVKFLKDQRDELLARRASELARATRLEDEATSIIEDGEMGDVQFDDEGGEGDTMVVQRDLDRVLSTQARQTILEIDAALAKIEEGTYGYSEVSGMPIPRERLEAIPETTVLAAEKVSGVGPR